MGKGSVRVGRGSEKVDDKGDRRGLSGSGMTRASRRELAHSSVLSGRVKMR